MHLLIETFPVICGGLLGVLSQSATKKYRMILLIAGSILLGLSIHRLSGEAGEWLVFDVGLVAASAFAYLGFYRIFMRHS